MVVFYLASYAYDFITSTLLYVCATILVTAIMIFYHRRLPALSLIFGFFVIVAGILTYLTDNPDIIILSDTIYFFFGAWLFYRSLGWSRPLLHRLFGHTFDLLPAGWRLLTWCWITIFLVAGISNEIVRHTMTPEWWIGFQFWRSVLITLFAFCLFPICRRFRNPHTTSDWGILVTPDTAKNN